MRTELELKEKSMTVLALQGWLAKETPCCSLELVSRI